MNFLYKTILIFLFSLFASQVNGQVCTDYHIENCKWADLSFFYSRQSRSALFSPGTTSKFKIIVYSNEEYYIAVAGHRKLDDIQIKVYVDNDEKEELYDNSNYNYEEFFYFKNEKTRKIIVEVSTKNTDNKRNKNKKYCVGVLIEYKKINQKKNNKKSKEIGF
ncbi:MAG: hypothetical protein U9R54_09780 [Bacteroidota bacterium]|nr:hypothetical protein [Bacteroidota bacterium]